MDRLHCKRGRRKQTLSCYGFESGEGSTYRSADRSNIKASIRPTERPARLQHLGGAIFLRCIFSGSEDEEGHTLDLQRNGWTESGKLCLAGANSVPDFRQCRRQAAHDPCLLLQAEGRDKEALPCHHQHSRWS